MKYRILLITFFLAVVNTLHSQYVKTYETITRKNSKCIIDGYNKELIPSGKYSDIEGPYDGEGKIFIITALNGNKGIYRLGEKEVLPCDFDEIRYHGNAGFVKKGNKWAVINSKPEVITGFDFEDVVGFKYNSAWIKKNGKMVIIDTTGKTIRDLPYDFVNPFVLYGPYSRAGIGNKFGYVDTAANIVIPIAYEDVGAESDGLIFSVKRNGKWGYVNSKNEIVLPINYPHVSEVFHDIGLIWDEKYNVIGAVNNKGKIIFDDARYKGIEYAGEGKFMVWEKDKGWGYIDSVTFRTVVSPRYSYCERFYNNHAIVKKDGFANIIDTAGNFLLPQKYTQISKWGDIFFVTENGKRGAINIKGEVLLPIEYDRIPYGGPFAKLYKNDLVGIMSIDRTVVIEPRYNGITEIGKTRFLVKRDNKLYILDETGKETPVEQ